MNLLILADMDDFHWPHGGGRADLLLACGDLSDSLILEAAQAYGNPRILAVKGNHDLPVPFSSPIEDIHLKVVECCGLRIGGFNGCWKYKSKGAFLYDQAEAHALLAEFPPVDILITHNSPHGIHDRDDRCHRGFKAYLWLMRAFRPRYLIHGHTHLYDLNDVRVSRYHSTTIVNAFSHFVLETEGSDA